MAPKFHASARPVVLIVSVLCLGVLAFASKSSAESYVAGQFGLTVPSPLRHVNDQGFTWSNLGLQNSMVYGV